MPIYSLAIQQAKAEIDSVRFIRRYSESSIAELRRLILNQQEVVLIDSEAYPLEFDDVAGREHQHKIFNTAVDTLLTIGDEIVCYYRPATDDPRECATLEQIKNLMYSEIQQGLR